MSTFTALPVGGTASSTLPQFDASLGVLRLVTIRVIGSVDGTLGLEDVPGLGSGRYLISTLQGTFLFDPATLLLTSIDPNPAHSLFDGPSPVVGATYCAGDGTATACPCVNSGASGNGCANSVSAAGASLRGAGGASISGDSLVLIGANMPDASVLYFQGTTPIAGGAGVAFGDGLRCAGGTTVRLWTTNNVGGASQVPLPGQPSISVRGGVTAPGVLYYQAWYRNAAVFCTASTFNLTNGLGVTWAP